MQVRLLGPLQVVTDDGPLGGAPARKERAVLAFLALRPGRVVQASELIAGLWGDEPPRSAAKTLQTYVSSLRRLLPVGGSIETFGGGYRLCTSPDDVDVSVFEGRVRRGCEEIERGDPAAAAETLREALALWGGEPLVDISDQPAGRAEATRLVELRETAEEQLFAARLALGEHAALVGDLEAAVAAEPLREGRWRHLMLALYRGGRQAEALRAYQRLRAVLGDELGLEPGEESRALEAAILAQDPSLVPGRPRPAAASIAEELPEGGLPEGNLSFLWSAVAGPPRSPRPEGGKSPEPFSAHREVLAHAAKANGGVLVSADGSRCLVVFTDGVSALVASLEAQLALAACSSPEEPLQARMGLQTGIAHPSPDGEYLAVAVAQAGRLAEAAHGGQVLVSAETAAMTAGALPGELSLVDRGLFLLDGFEEPERVFQLVHQGLSRSFPALRASPAMSHNLPDQRTSFIGRDDSLESLDRLLDAGRLVSVVGPGGSGKTRLALEVAARASTRFEAGAHLSDLSPLTDPSLVLATVASSFEVRESGGEDLASSVARALAGRRALLIVDNCEHLLDSVAAVADSLLSEAEGLSILATSRQPLGLAGERVWRISPLEVPGTSAGLDEVAAAESVRLFEDRACLVEPSFSVTAQNAADLASICRHLEGLPLAIELAAARVTAASPRVLASRLADRLQVLTAGPRGASGRHRTLEATVDWSYRLLSDPERWLLRRLSVFAGGFTLAAAEAVAGDVDPFETLASLVDKSLVVWDPDAGRYRLLETIRTCAESRLKEADEHTPAAMAHLVWCTAFAESLREVARGTEEVRGYELVEREIDNLRAALAFAVGGHHAEGLRLVWELRSYWCNRAEVEGERWSRRVIEAVPEADPLEVGRVLSTAAFCASEIGRFDLAAVDADLAIAVLARAGDEGELLQARLMRASLRMRPEELEACRTEHLQVAEAATRLGDRLTEAGALLNLAAKEIELGDPASGRRHAEEGLGVLAEFDCPPRARLIGLANLGAAMVASGSPASDALRVLGEALDLVEEVQMPAGAASAVQSLAECLVELDPDGAARVLGAALGLRQAHGLGTRPFDMATVARIRETIESRIGHETTRVLFESTGEVTVDEAVEIARAVISDGALEAGSKAAGRNS